MTDLPDPHVRTIFRSSSVPNSLWFTQMMVGISALFALTVSDLFDRLP